MTYDYPLPPANAGADKGSELLLDAIRVLTKYSRPGSTEAALILRVREFLDATPAPSPKLEELRQRVVDATRHERHRTKGESRYWCDQYKQIAHGFVSVLEGK